MENTRLRYVVKALHRRYKLSTAVVEAQRFSEHKEDIAIPGATTRAEIPL